MTIKTGWYRGKPIIAVTIPGTNTVQRFKYQDNPDCWYFPLIENGENAEKDEFKLEQPVIQITLFELLKEDSQ